MVIQFLQWKNHIFLCLVITIVACAPIFNVFADNKIDIPPPKGKFSEETICVEPVDVMRRQHFDFILDHRDKTVVQGIRTQQYSLIGCIDCHITANAKGEYARYSEETHFCASCHQFTAVNIDCFQCHSDRPENVIRESIKQNQAKYIDLQKTHEHLQLSDMHIQ